MSGTIIARILFKCFLARSSLSRERCFHQRWTLILKKLVTYQYPLTHRKLIFTDWGWCQTDHLKILVTFDKPPIPFDNRPPEDTCHVWQATDSIRWPTIWRHLSWLTRPRMYEMGLTKLLTTDVVKRTDQLDDNHAWWPILTEQWINDDDDWTPIIKQFFCISLTSTYIFLIRMKRQFKHF